MSKSDPNWLPKGDPKSTQNGSKWGSQDKAPKMSLLDLILGAILGGFWSHLGVILKRILMNSGTCVDAFSVVSFVRLGMRAFNFGADLGERY